MGLLIANDNLLTALGITNKEQFDQTFADFSEFETFVEKCGYEYDFDEEGNLILITPKSKEINTGINGFKPDKNYFYVEALEDGKLYFTPDSNKDSNNNQAVGFYSLNGFSWNELPNQFSINLEEGQKMYFKSNRKGYEMGTAWQGRYNIYDGSQTNVYSTFYYTNKFNVGGDIRSLFYLDDFEDKIEFPQQSSTKVYPCAKLFANNNGLISAANLEIHIKDFKVENAFHSMFKECRNLVMAPEKLPATTLTQSCYTSMFYNCKKLTTAPELPATTLAYLCYSEMFSGCTSLVSAPELPATTLANNCYQSMFQGCSSLVNAPELPATTLGNNCYNSMFMSCSNLVNAPELPATTLKDQCYYQMFQGCSSLITAPELPATTLTHSCYNYIFRDCTNLNYIKAMFTNSPSGFTYWWVYNVSPTGTFVKNSAATWNETGNNGIPEGWTVETADS